jgi:hypothetical protein
LPSKFFQYLDGAIPLPSEPAQEATGLFPCNNGCYASASEAIIQGGKAYYTCPNGHKNVEEYHDGL